MNFINKINPIFCRESHKPTQTRASMSGFPFVTFVWFAVSFFFSCFYLSAQTINLEQARELALANSRSLARYELAIRSSVLDEKNQFYSMLPQVSAGYSASAYYLRDWGFVNPVDTFSAGLNLSISQIIFRGGKSFIEKAIASISTESVKLDAQSEYFNVLDFVDNAYYAVLESASSLEAEESTLKTASLGLEIAEIRQRSGMINQGDYLKALADKESRENSFNQSRRSHALNITRFKNLTGITETPEFEKIAFSLYDDILTHLAGISDEDADFLLEKLRAIMEVSNLTLAKAQLNNQRAEKNYESTKRDYAPTITAEIFSGGIGFSSPDRFNTPGGTGGVSLRGTIPVDFWVLKNRTEKNRIALDSSNIDYVNSYNNVEQELQNALSAAYAQAGSVLSSRRSLEYTEKHIEFIMERYRLSQASVSDLNEATTLFINSRNSLNRASYSFLQSLSKLRFLLALDDENKLISLLLPQI